jgi:hypothetical protein
MIKKMSNNTKWSSAITQKTGQDLQSRKSRGKNFNY